MSSTNSNVKNAATEQATLIHMLTELKKKANLLGDSLSQYIDKHEVSLAYIPRNIDSINQVLSRFLKDKKIKDIFELIDKKPDFIASAIEFVRNPIKGSSRAAYNEAFMTLKTIKDNIDEYKNFDSAEDGNLKFDGFENYVKTAQLIIDVNKDYEALMLYTDAPELNLNNIPKNFNELKATQLAIGAPLDNSASETTKEDNNNDSPFDADGRFEVGSEPYLALINKSAREAATADITNRKYICYKEAVVIRLEYNNCVTKSQGDSTNLDLNCASLAERYEISKANCDNHYPMITVSDLLIEDVLMNIEKVHMIADSEGAYVIDQSTSAQAAQNYITVGNTLTIAPPQSIEGIEYNKDYSAINEVTKTVKDSAIRMLGNTMNSIGCGALCEEKDSTGEIINDETETIANDVKLSGEINQDINDNLYEDNA